jgi:ParB family chromosome partitioning protein
MEPNHWMFRTLLDHGADKSRWDSASEVANIGTKASTAKAATMTITLAAVVTAWEATTGKHSWRKPSRRDSRMLGALMEWGYEPSEVERILLVEEPASVEADVTDEASDGTSDSAA